MIKINADGDLFRKINLTSTHDQSHCGTCFQGLPFAYYLTKSKGMHKPIENIRQEWDNLRKVKGRVQQEYLQWKSLEKRIQALYNQLKDEMAWDAELLLNDKFPEAREARIILHHIFPLGDELVGYNNSATLIFEQRLSGQVLVWHLFPQKEHFTRYEGLQARHAGSFKIDQLLQDDNLILFQIESFLHQLQGWMLEVLPEPAEERTATEF